VTATPPASGGAALLDRLGTRVQRTPNPADGRSSIVRATPGALPEDALHEALDALAARRTPAERATIAAFLTEARSALIKHGQGRAAGAGGASRAPARASRPVGVGTPLTR